MVAGDDWQMVVTATSAVGGRPADLTQWTLTGSLSFTPAPGAPVTSPLSLLGSYSSSSPSSGVSTLVVPRAVTAYALPGYATLAVSLTDPFGFKTTTSVVRLAVI